ncbi:Sec-independent protein translocase subunit TatA [Umezawaea sp. NPDC059074]|uniref:Sec-independent protein translocase subunit TatA n=1 Tax=Umezawaea sp. NPDC059074 TaxID=3346716 RepID=UPI0036C58996
MGNLGATELLIIAGVIVLLFGSKKLPEMARSLGRSARILKAETSGGHDEDHGAQVTSLPPPSPAAVVGQESETSRIQRQIEELQRQLTIAQQAQTPKDAH